MHLTPSREQLRQYASTGIVSVNLQNLVKRHERLLHGTIDLAQIVGIRKPTHYWTKPKESRGNSPLPRIAIVARGKFKAGMPGDLMARGGLFDPDKLPRTLVWDINYTGKNFWIASLRVKYRDK